MKKFWELNWLKWLPVLGNLFFLVLFYSLLNKYSKAYKDGQTAFYIENMLSWHRFFTGAGYIALLVSTACSFFIKNKWLKLLSIAMGIITFAIIFYNVGKFNPL